MLMSTTHSTNLLIGGIPLHKQYTIHNSKQDTENMHVSFKIRASQSLKPQNSAFYIYV